MAAGKVTASGMRRAQSTGCGCAECVWHVARRHVRECVWRVAFRCIERTAA